MIRHIYCCECGRQVSARLTNGAEIYPHRDDLAELPFWRCTLCGNHVGCHHKTNNPTRPLGVIPTPEIREVRMQIHAVMDPLWRSGFLTRSEIYGRLSDLLGRPYHTAGLRTLAECERMLDEVLRLRKAAQPAAPAEPDHHPLW